MSSKSVYGHILLSNQQVFAVHDAKDGLRPVTGRMSSCLANGPRHCWQRSKAAYSPCTYLQQSPMTLRGCVCSHSTACCSLCHEWAQHFVEPGSQIADAIYAGCWHAKPAGTGMLIAANMLVSSLLQSVLVDSALHSPNTPIYVPSDHGISVPKQTSPGSRYKLL